MGLQRSACCHCAASNYCPGLASSHWLLWPSVWGCVCCVTHDGVSREKKEKKKWVWLDRE
eukprot:1160871-Pelagomonas_calceolata.AAC.2